MGYKIRCVRKSDLPAIVQIETLSHPRPWTLEDFEWEFKNAGSKLHFWVVTKLKDDLPLAYLCFNFVIDEIYIRNLTVGPSERRKGIGKKLLDLCCLWGKRKGAVRIVLDVRVGNYSAISFYRKCGFHLIKGCLNRTSRLMEKAL